MSVYSWASMAPNLLARVAFSAASFSAIQERSCSNRSSTSSYCFYRWRPKFSGNLMKSCSNRSGTYTRVDWESSSGISIIPLLTPMLRLAEVGLNIVWELITIFIINTIYYIQIHYPNVRTIRWFESDSLFKYCQSLTKRLAHQYIDFRGIMFSWRSNLHNTFKNHRNRWGSSQFKLSSHCLRYCA